MREPRVRGGAAFWPSLTALIVWGGVQECNLAARVGCEAWADSPAIGHGLEEKRNDSIQEFLVSRDLSQARPGSGARMTWIGCMMGLTASNAMASAHVDAPDCTAGRRSWGHYTVLGPLATV